MNTVFAIIALCLLAVGFVLAINKPIQFTFFWAIFGCSYDGCGIVMYLNTCFGLYRLIMNNIILMCCLLSIFRFYRKSQKRTVRRFMAVAVFFMLGILVSEIVVFITSSVSIINMTYGFVEFGPTLFIIWLANYERFSKKYDSRKAIISFVSVQVIIATMIVYLPQFGIHILDVFSGSNYISDGYIYNRNVLINIFELPNIFVNKYLYNGLGQFHNANDMGFYGAVGLLLAIVIVVREKKIWRKLFGIGLAYLSLLMWGNSGMRGPVIGLICGAIISYILWKKPSKWTVGFLGVVMIIAFLFSEIGMELIVFLIPESENVSFSGRQILRANGLEYLKHNWIVGAGGLIGNLTQQNIDPHELPLRISCLFGVLTGVFCTLLIYVYPIITFIKVRRKDSIIIIFWMILFCVSISNNYTCIGLYWILFSESICLMCYGSKSANGEELVSAR